MCIAFISEYAMGCKISTSGDVYSFGVLLLEMLTAKRPTDKLFGNDLSLHKYVGLAFPDKISEILDPQMQNKEDEILCNLHMQNYIIPLVEIGLMCSMESPKDRPAMKDVYAKIIAIQEGFIQTFWWWQRDNRDAILTSDDGLAQGKHYANQGKSIMAVYISYSPAKKSKTLKCVKAFYEDISIGFQRITL